MATPAELAWVGAEGGYAVALRGGQVVARGPHGNVLRSVPAALRDSDPVRQLRELRDWLTRHERECLATVESWMIRSLPVPTRVLHAVWPDPAWQHPLRDAIVVPVDSTGAARREHSGFLRAANAERGIGVIRLTDFRKPQENPSRSSVNVFKRTVRVSVAMVATILGMWTARMPRRVVLAAAIAGLGLGPRPLGSFPGASADAQPVAARYRMLVFSRTAGFRHDSIPDAIAAVRVLGDQYGFDVDATEDPSVFTDSGLKPYSAVSFLMTTGDVLDDSQQAAFERYIAAGNGFVGVHSAADTEYDWPWYGGLMGAYFASHPDIQSAVVHREEANHLSTVWLPDLWVRTDEWYNFQTNPRDSGDIHVLATLDESSYAGGTMGDHPIAWYHAYAGGRAWYTAGGHTPESYSEPLFLQHLMGGIEYAAG